MTPHMRIYALLGALLLGTCWLERTAHAQEEYEVDIWALCDLTAVQIGTDFERERSGSFVN